ncbi:MAG: addiction module protein [Planctomycetes bacterium]|nr:addiction module protein [Planctomycetota bacterium]
MSQIPSKIANLGVAERLDLVQAIWESIEANQESLPVSEAERQELARRLTDFQFNPGTSSPWADVKARLLDRE